MNKYYRFMITSLSDGSARRGFRPFTSFVSTFVLFVMLLTVNVFSLKAQDVIVTAEAKTNIFPSQVNNYVDSPWRYFRIRLQNLSGTTQRVYLTLNIECQYSASGTPFQMQTVDVGRSTRPYIELAPNQIYVIDNRERYDSHFAGRIQTNMSNNTLSMLSRLPEGNYNLCVNVCRWSQNVSQDVSMNQSCLMFTVCYTGSAPELITPIGGMNPQFGYSAVEIAPVMIPQRNLNFRWMGVITNCAQMTRFNYVLKMVKVLPGQNVNDAIKRNSTFLSRECGSRTYCSIDTLRDLNVPFERGATYAVQVIANQRGNTILQLGNDGKSQVMCFTWGQRDTCVPGVATGEGNGTTSGNDATRPGDDKVTVKHYTTFFTDRSEIVDSILPPCIVAPAPDSTQKAALLELQPTQSSNIPNVDRKVVSTYLVDGTPVIDTTVKKIDFKWLHARHDKVRIVNYDVKLYEHMGNLNVTFQRPALKTKRIEGSFNTHYGYSNNNLVSLDDESWTSGLQKGKQYVLVVEAHAGITYTRYDIDVTVYKRQGKEDSTVYDTTRTVNSDAAVITSWLVFQYGIDESLLDKLTPPQFTYPVDRSTAAWDDSTHLEFDREIPEIPYYDDFSFDWKEADGYDVSDTILYDLYIYDCPAKKKMSEILEGKHKWLYKDINNLTLTDSIADSLKVGSTYIARLRVHSTPDSNKYNRLADGWSLPIAFKLVDTTVFSGAFDVTNACFPSDTVGLSRKVITPKVDSLISNRTRLKMGRFDLIVQKGKLTGKKYSGEGFVVWHPMGFGCNIKVHFDSIVINEKYQIISGTARSIETDTNNYIRLNIDGSKWAAGFDMASDQAAQSMDYIAKKIGEKGEDVKTWYERINMGSNALTEMIRSGVEGDFALGTVTTPVRIDNKMFNIKNANFALAVNDFFFSPVTAQINLLAVYGSPRDDLYIPAIATNICIAPNAFATDSNSNIVLFTPRDYEFELADGYTMRFKKPSNFAQVKDGCHMTIKKNKVDFTIDVDLDFGKKGQDGNKLLSVDLKNNGIVDPTKPVMAHFRTTISDWDDWYVKVAMDPFTVVGCEKYTFLPTGRGIIFDHSSKRTPEEVRFPANYVGKGKRDQWKGLYIDYFGIMMPEDVSNTFVDLNGEDDDTPDSTVVYRVGANGENTDTIDYVYPGHRISFTASKLLWDKDGLSVLVSVNDIFKGETRNGGGWYFSLDTVGINIEKSKFKYGKIDGQVKLPLFEGRMKYSCMLGTDSLVFAITPGDSLNLNLFLAKVKLDKKSSYFRINHDYGGHTTVIDKDKVTGTKYTMLSDKSTTRVDLNLSGTIDIDLDRIGVDASLPAIKFENMYMRNFREKDYRQGTKAKVKAYEFGSIDFCIGNWSKASPQKYIGTAPRPVGGDDTPKGDAEGEEMFKGKVGGFEYSVTGINPFYEKLANKDGVYKVGLDVGGKMTLGISEDMSFGASAGFAISCEVNVSDFDVSNWGGQFDSVRFKTDIGPLKVEAAILHTREDTVFGNSWRGMAKVTVMESVTCAMGCGFGSLPKPDGSGNYDWWYFEGAAQLGKTGVPVGPVSINGFGGGFAYNCMPNREFAGARARDMMSKDFVDGMVSKNGCNYKPQYDAWMAKAGISLCLTGNPKTLNADGTLNLRIANGHFSGICLQVNAHMMSSYDEENKEASSSMLDIGAFIDYTRRGEGDWTLTFSACAKSEIDMKSLLKNAAASFVPADLSLPGSCIDKVKGAMPGSLSKYIEPIIDSTVAMANLDEKEKKLKERDFGASLSMQIPIDLYINKSPDKETEWFFALGRPAYDDRVRFKFEFDLVVLDGMTEWTFYFMTGNHFPDGFALPPIPDEVAEFLGGKYAQRAERGRILPTFKDAGGFAMGVSFAASINFSMILFVEASAYIGFDAAIIDTKGQGCEGYSTIGKNNFYGMGQAYMMLKGKAGLELNLGFWKGRLDLIDAGLGAIVQAGGPNPTWAFGMLRFKCALLGGKIKINTAVDFELGETCIPGAGNPLANVKLFQSVTPGYTKDDYTKPENVSSPFTTGVIVSNMPWNQDVLLSAVDSKNEQVTRKFKFILDQRMSTYEYMNNSGIWQKIPLNISSSSTDENTLYYSSNTGGFRPQSQQRFHFYGRVFEYRSSLDHNLSDYYCSRDTAYYTGYNYVSVRFAPNATNKGIMAWRLPLFTDNKVTTFVTDKNYYQDTLIYLKTEDAPENLYNQVVYTWPYNGDPMVPIEELYRSNGRYRVLIYTYAHNQILDPDAIDKSGRQIKAFLVESGWGETATAIACDYIYYEDGFQGSTHPCIEVVLPSDFNPSRYNGRNLAVRLMLVRKKDYQAQLDALNNKANEIMTQTKYEQQSRSNLGELYNTYLKTAVDGIVSGNTATSTSQDSTRASGASTGEGNASANFNVRLAQLQEAVKEYIGDEKDTAMNYSRVSLASGYVAAVRAGDAIYNLYFRFCDKYTSYKQILDNVDIGYLFDASAYTHDGSSSMVFSVKNKPTTPAQINAARFGYLFEEYEPDDPTQYMTGVRLPPIMNAIVDYTWKGSGNEFIDLYNFYAQNVVAVQGATMRTYAPLKRPKADCKDGYTHIFCSGVKSSNWCAFDEGVYGYYLKDAASVGLILSSKDNEFINTASGVRVYRNLGAYVDYGNAKVSGAYIPYTMFEDFGPNCAPRLLKWSSIDHKARIDSLHLLGRQEKYVMSDFVTTYNPAETYSASFQITDEVTGTLVDDIKKFNNFFQALFDCGVYMHSRGYSYKVDELATLLSQSKHLNTLSLKDSPYTFPKSVFANWWMEAFYAKFKANEATGEQRFKYYDKKPYIERDQMVDYRDYPSALYWQDYVLHMDRLPMELNKTKGSPWTTLFASNSKYSNGFNSQWFVNGKTGGIIPSIAEGSTPMTLKLAILYTDFRNGYKVLGKAANRAAETATNKDAHPMIATQMYKPASTYFKFKTDTGNKLKKTINESRGLKFRTYIEQNDDKLDNDWFE